LETGLHGRGRPLITFSRKGILLKRFFVPPIPTERI
jgi:hypothetical protein